MHKPPQKSLLAVGPRYLVFDVSNLLYKTFFVNKQEGDITIAGMAQHTALVTLNKYFKAYKPDKIVMAFDRPSWRIDYTKSTSCLSQRPYKGNRRQKMTPSEKAKYELFKRHLADFEVLIRENTTVAALAGESLEADDLIAGFCQMYSIRDDNSEIIVISSDKDMIQLLGNPGVRVVDPSTGKDRTLTEWDNDADYFLFEKCIRGDIGDNVMSAFPRVKSTRIKKAFYDKDERTNLMETSWKNIDDRVFKVKDIFKENELLMDLRKQPDDIQRRMITTVLQTMDSPGSFSYFNFMKFLGKYELKKIAEQAELFAQMLSR